MEDFQSELSKMDERLTELEEKIDRIDNKLTQVIDALTGNPLVKSDGLVSRFDKFEKDVQDLKEFKKRIIYTVSAIVAIGLVIQFFLRIYVDVKK